MMEEIEEIFKLALVKDQRLVTAISFTDLYIYMLAVLLSLFIFILWFGLAAQILEVIFV
jgi:hypothetical protein